ncbi:hydrogenase expression protein HypA [Streptomyces sp. NPDC088115]|uniref:hydrogenase expression protein HypA n=1 Tax=Streptomyces sp. NPDC088115 TaxID=3365824 RepID=UPI003804851B
MSVRRAVPMRGTAGDPGDALMPGGSRIGKDTSSPAAGPDAGARSPSSESGEGEGSGHEAPEAAGSEKETGEQAGGEGAASTSSAASASSAAGAARAGGTPEPAAADHSEDTSATSAEAGATSATSASSASPDPDPAPAAATATTRTVGGPPPAAAAAAAGDGGGGAGTHADDVPPNGRLKKPMLAAAAIAGAVLISVPFLVAGQDDRKPEKEQTQNAAGTVLDSERPVSPETYTSESPKPSVTPSKKKEKEKEEKKETVRPSATPTLKAAIAPPPQPKAPVARPTATVTAKAPPGTAASAMSSLAKNDPHGRHICYRAFVAEHGWQQPVCDGTVTGTTDQGKKITALNIAVWNVEGSSANALLHDPGSTSGNSKWAPNWTAVIADGKNNYIGSSKKGAPFLTGFAMNIGDGSVCHTAKMGGGGWGPQICKNKRPEYMFVGTTANDHWFEAVRLTV